MVDSPGARSRQRLHKFIANCGYCSRRRAELLILAGRVQLNGKVVQSLGTKVAPDRDEVRINGEPVSLPPPTTIAFNKPAGVITSTHDTHERLTVMDFLPRSLVSGGVVPVGRLDQDTEGLLLLTNVGDLNHRVTHPRYEKEKEYVATLARRPSEGSLRKLERGIELDGEMTAAARVGPVVATADPRFPGGVEVHITLREGRKRQVRRMFSAIGHEVLRLERVRIGPLELGTLPRGEWRRLEPAEIAALASGTEAREGETDEEDDDPADGG